MKYNFDEIINRIGTASEKWESGGHGGVYFDKNSLSFSIADMDFALAPCIDRAIRDRLDQKVLGYTDVNTDDYRGNGLVRPSFRLENRRQADLRRGRRHAGREKGDFRPYRAGRRRYHTAAGLSAVYEFG